MRADRLISLLILIQKRNGISARQLAQELEVSERTIYRDLTALSTAGIPVFTRSGPGGGCFLVEEYRTTLTGMTSDQASALFALNIPTPLDQLGLSHDLKAALLKISAALPVKQRVEEERHRQRLFLDWGKSGRIQHQPVFLHAIQQAAWQDRRVRISFRSFFSPWIDPLEQVSCPYSLVAWAGDWYAVCQWGDSLHVIRIDLVQSVEMLAETFTRPADYNLPAFWNEWRHRLEVERPVFAVRVRVAPSLVPYLPDWHPFSVEPDGWQTGTMMFETFEKAREKLLSFGGAVIILEPDALRKSTLDFARQILQAYE